VSTQANVTIASADGKLGVLIPGLGAVTSTFIAGVEAVKQGLGEPIGSLTQLGTIRLGKRTDARVPRIKDFVPLTPLECLSFGTWDIYEDNAYEAALNASVLDRSLLAQLKNPLSEIKPMKAVFDHEFVKRINGPNVKSSASKMELAEALMADIQEFKRRNSCSRLVMIWCGSTEIFMKPGEAHASLKSFEKALNENNCNIAPSMIYAYAALKEGVPFANGAPNLTVDIPALQELARKNNAPICGKDFKTGQTLLKTVLAPAFKVGHVAALFRKGRTCEHDVGVTGGSRRLDIVVDRVGLPHCGGILADLLPPDLEEVRVRVAHPADVRFECHGQATLE